MRHKGRKKILSDLIPTGDIEQDKILIPKIIDITLSYHNENVEDIKQLRDYYYNITNIL